MRPRESTSWRAIRRRGWRGLQIFALLALLPSLAMADGALLATGEALHLRMVSDLSPPPLERAPIDAVRDNRSALDRQYRFRMTMAYGSAGLMAAGLMPFSVAVALHEIWPCGGRNCIQIGTLIGISGLVGLSLFLFGAGATAHWATSGAQALHDPKAPFSAIWMGRLGFVFWGISEILLTLAIFAPGAGLFWVGTLFGLASIPLAIGQLVSTTLQRQRQAPGTPRDASGHARFWAAPIARWSFVP